MPHALAFFVLGLLGLRAFPEPTWRVTTGLLGYGALIEVLQGMTSYRTAEWNDLLADGVGIAMAIGACGILQRLNLQESRLTVETLNPP